MNSHSPIDTIYLHGPQKRYYFSHNSPGGRARKVFKPSPDSERLVVSIKKNFRFGFSVDDVIIIGGCFRIFGQLFVDLGANPTSHFLDQEN